MLVAAGSASGLDKAAQGKARLDPKPGAFIPMDLTFRDEGGKEISLRQVVDRPVILSLVYYSCSHICPQMLAGLSTAADAMKFLPGRDYRMVTLSFDEDDTPSDAMNAKKNYTEAIQRPLEPDAWKFLTGDRENIRKIAGSAGISFEKTGHGYVHPEVLIFLSPAGRITRYMPVEKYDYGVAYPVSFSPVGMEKAVAEASAGRVSRGGIATPLYCFLHEPSGQARYFTIVKTAGLLTLILLALFYTALRAKEIAIRKKQRGE